MSGAEGGGELVEPGRGKIRRVVQPGCQLFPEPGQRRCEDRSEWAADHDQRGVHEPGCERNLVGDGSKELLGVGHRLRVTSQRRTQCTALLVAFVVQAVPAVAGWQQLIQGQFARVAVGSVVRASTEQQRNAGAASQIQQHDIVHTLSRA